MEHFTIEKHKGKNPIYGIVNEGNCWVCTSHKEKKRHKTGKSNYFQIGRRVNGKKEVLLMHRYVYQLYKGDILEGMVIRHTCDNTQCINPEHLIEGTQIDNINDMVIRNRNESSKGENNIHSKLTNKERIEISDLYRNKIYNQTELGNLYGVSQRQIGNVVSSKIEYSKIN